MYKINKDGCTFSVVYSLLKIKSKVKNMGKYNFFENCWCKFHFCQHEIHYITFASAFFYWREINHLFWFAHVCCSDRLIKTCTQHGVAGKREHRQPRNTWWQCIYCNLKSLKLSKDFTSNHNAWREALGLNNFQNRKLLLVRKSLCIIYQHIL